MRLFYTITQTGHIFNLGRTKTYELVHAGDLILVKVGSKSLITAESIRSYYEKLTGSACPDTRDEPP